MLVYLFIYLPHYGACKIQEWLFVPKENNPVSASLSPSPFSSQWAHLQMKTLDLPRVRIFLSLCTLQCMRQLLSLGDPVGDNADSVSRGQPAAAGTFFSAFPLLPLEALQSLNHCPGPSVGKSQSFMMVAIPPHISSHQPFLPSPLLSGFFLCHCVMISVDQVKIVLQTTVMLGGKNEENQHTVIRAHIRTTKESRNYGYKKKKRKERKWNDGLMDTE